MAGIQYYMLRNVQAGHFQFFLNDPHRIVVRHDMLKVPPTVHALPTYFDISIFDIFHFYAGSTMNGICSKLQIQSDIRRCSCSIASSNALAMPKCNQPIGLMRTMNHIQLYAKDDPNVLRLHYHNQEGI